ncbi:MAG: ABC transporter ATP-binding protein [Candidatus Nanopelagicaceae bacterium]|nr:ABC transporter ATP-binding protein [Candidatus Nanopelagicaceae bacterium]
MGVIEVRDLRKSYSAVQAVNGIDLSIDQGEIFAILGPNGAGKTTSVEILEGFRERDSGDVRVLGMDPAVKGKSARNFRDRIGIVLQSTSDAGDLTVSETLTHFSGYYSKPRKAPEVIESIGLGEKSNALIHTLSGGQRRRLDVGLGIIGNPELLFLDEPTTGFDPEARRSFWELIRTLRESGTTIVLTTHYLDEAEALADRVAVINAGQILEIATPANLGDRATSLARVRWEADGKMYEEFTSEPTAVIARLSKTITGEIPKLTVLRATLEDVYLEMIGEVTESHK